MITPEQCRQELQNYDDGIDDGLEEVFDRLFLAAGQGNSCLKFSDDELTNVQVRRLNQLGYGTEYSATLKEDTISW